MDRHTIRSSLFFMIGIALSWVNNDIIFASSIVVEKPAELLEQKTVKSSVKQPETSNSHALFVKGFACTPSTKDATLEVKGTVPAWLTGSYYAVGPGQCELDGKRAPGWFDGFAMAHRFTLNADHITYANHVIESEYAAQSRAQGKITGTVPEVKPSTWSKVSSLWSSNQRPAYDNTNLNVVQLDRHLLALTETPHAYALEGKQITSSRKTYHDNLECQFCCAHLAHDNTRHGWYSFGINFARSSSYQVYSIDARTLKRTVIATIPVSNPAYMHSFALTPTYIILIETPFVVSPWDLFWNNTAFLDTFQWKPQLGTQFIVLERRTGAIVGSFKTDPFFMLHCINAYEKESKLHIDLPCYSDAQVVKSFKFCNIFNPDFVYPRNQLRRYTIDLKDKKITNRVLSTQHLEMPRINPDTFCHAYEYVYGMSTTVANVLTNQLVKVQVNTGTVCTWQHEGCFPSEPLFIPKPHAKTQDEGVVFSIVYDANAHRSFLLILDAQSYKEVARAVVPHHISYCVHGTWQSLAIKA